MIYERIVHETKFEDIATMFNTSKSTANLVYKQYLATGFTNRKLNSMERVSVRMFQSIDNSNVNKAYQDLQN